MKFTVLRPLQHEHGAAENGGVRLPAMKTPAFFEAVPAIVVIDPLAETLGAAENGVIEYHYRDAVKLAGHSCPTVAGAWLMTRTALAHLYPDGVPQRGGMRVELRQAVDEGLAVGAECGMETEQGVMAS